MGETRCGREEKWCGCEELEIDDEAKEVENGDEEDGVEGRMK